MEKSEMSTSQPLGGNAPLLLEKNRGHPEEVSVNSAYPETQEFPSPCEGGGSLQVDTSQQIRFMVGK